MARIDTLTNFLTDVADAIRTKTGSAEPIPAEDFDTEIENIPSGGGLDWSAIGYSEEPDTIKNDYNYAKNIYDNWDATKKSCYQMYKGNIVLRYFPLVDTSSVNDMFEMFRNCTALAYVPAIDCSHTSYGTTSMFQSCTNLVTVEITSVGLNMGRMFSGCTNLKNISIVDASRISGSTTAFQYMFQSCSNLTDTSLDNILQMCISAVNYSGTKTLVYLGFSSTDYPVSRIEALPHYQDFLNANWTIGY